MHISVGDMTSCLNTSTSTHMHFGQVSVCVQFACTVCNVFFVSYSRLLTLRVCLGGDEERIERVQETLNSKTNREEGEKTDRKEEWMTLSDQLCASAHVGC